jgi:monoamine oxidase
MGISRRDFLMRVGQAGGYSAAFLAMQGLGLTEAHAIQSAAIQAAPGSGKGIKVAILGAGIAGMVTGYELRALGYDCTILEARTRPGGRNWSVRGGTEVKFVDGSTQTCSWDKGYYQNVGPARLPSIHKAILGYCKKLGVQLEVEVNVTTSEYLQNDNASNKAPMLFRRVDNDTRGHVSELLAKCINQGALDQDMSKEDRDRMLSFLRIYGELDQAGKYTGSPRAGYSQWPGAGNDTGVLEKPIDMHTLLDDNFWQGMLYTEAFDMQATMFQPVGGMDRIPYAFAKALGPMIKYDSPITEIRKTAKGVRIGYTEKGSPKMIEADYCICALPLNIMRKIPNDLSAPYKKVIDECTYAGAYKLAWQSRRFWEQDYNIYGGMEFVSVGPSPIWFPSWGMFTDTGIVLSGYTDESRTAFGQMTLAEKCEESRKSIERLHPGHGKELQKPIYVGWSKVPYNEGSWIRSYGSDVSGGEGSSANLGYETLLQPDGPIIIAGDHCTRVVAWQEGAALSALRAVQMLSDKTKAARLAGGEGDSARSA